MKFRSQLSASIATQIGTLQGTLEARAQGKIQEYITKYSQQCPTVVDFRGIVNTLNNIQNTSNQVKKRVNTFQRLASRLNTTINRVSTLVTLLRVLPTPTAIAGIGIPIGVTNRQAELLINTAEFLDGLRNEQRVIISIVQNASNQLGGFDRLLDSLLIILQKCANENPELLPFLNQLQRDTGDLTAELGPDRSYRASNGKVYFFEITEEPKLIGPIPRRIAVAKDRSGVIVLRGAPSFSSSTKVLIDELKLRIDNQLP